MKSLTNQIGYLLLAALFITTSCSDDEEDPSRRDLLIGTWEIRTGELVDYSVTVEGIEINRDNVGTIALVVPEVNDIVQAIEEGADVLFPSGTVITFNDDNSFTLDDQTEVTTGTWSLSDDEETITVQVVNDLGVDQLDFSIRSLTDQQVDIALRVDEEDVNLESFDLDSLPVAIEGFAIDYNFSFSKQ